MNNLLTLSVITHYKYNIINTRLNMGISQVVQKDLDLKIITTKW